MSEIPDIRPPERRPSDEAVEAAARAHHEEYESLAPAFGYRTRVATRVPWDELPIDVRELMLDSERAAITAYLQADPLTEKLQAENDRLSTQEDRSLSDAERHIAALEEFTEKLWRVVELQTDYIELLESGLAKNAVYLHVHGIHDSDEDIARGKELRAALADLDS